MALNSPVFNRIMNQYSLKGDSKSTGLIQVDNKQNLSAMASEPVQNQFMKQNQFRKGESSMAYPSINDITPNPTGSMEGYLEKLANVESNGKYDAKNKSGAYGKYQFMPSTEAEWANKIGITTSEARTPEGQEKLIRAFTKHNKTGLSKAGIEPSDLNMWVAHNQGLQGAINMIKYGKGNTNNIRNNIVGMEPTVENYLNYWSNKFN